MSNYYYYFYTTIILSQRTPFPSFVLQRQLLKLMKTLSVKVKKTAQLSLHLFMYMESLYHLSLSIFLKLYELLH